MTEKLIRNENEAIDVLKKNKPTSGYYMLQESVDMAIQALEEVQAYRAIGTPTQIYEKIGGLDIELGKYHSIGTIDEFKALKEKNEPKKVDEEYCCPICHTCGMDDDGIAGAYCTDCGQALDWQ